MANPEHLKRLRRSVSGWNTWRRGSRARPNLIGADLDMARLSGVNLRHAILVGAGLCEVELDQADLGKADFAFADLRVASLRQANLCGASFSEARLAGANLKEANLVGANLTGADLSGSLLSEADLSRASLMGTLFVDVDLSEVKGLEKVRHRGPSTIGIDTIYKSGGRIPEVFLRGCGVPEDFITYMPSLVGTGIEFCSCFISYSHADKAFARRLHDALQGRRIRCWLDEHQLLPGDDIYAGVDRGIRLWDKVLLCCSKASLKSWWVDNEIGKAFAKEQELMKERGEKTLALIPLNLDGALFDWRDGKADEIRRRLAADFTGWKRNHAKFEREFEKLVKALTTDDGGREKPPKARI